MAKLTLTDGTIFEGTTEEIFAITERYNGAKADEPSGVSKEITHNGVAYTLVDRKAQEDDVVIPTAESSSIFVIKDTPYVVETGSDGQLEIEGYDVYNSQYNRTTETVLVYAPKAETVPTSLKVGDYAVVIGNTPSVGKVVKLIEAWDITSVKFDVIIVGAPNKKGLHVNNLRKATDEEVAEAKAKAEASAEKARKEVVFTQAGRNPNEYRNGDIVRILPNEYKSHLVGNIEEVTDMVGIYSGGNIETASGNKILGKYVAPITFVESRLDRN